VHHAPRHRIGGRPPGQRVGRQLAGARRQHQVAEPASAQHPGVRDHAGVREDRPRRRDLRTGVRQRRAVGHVGGEDPAVAERAAGGGRELHRGQVGRSAAAGENVRDDHVEGPGRHPVKDSAGIADLNPGPPAGSPAGPQRQPALDEPPEGLVHLDGQLRRTRPGRRHVADQRQGPGAQVQHVQRLTLRRRHVDQVPQPPDVLELQVPRVVEIDVRLRDAIDQQHPRRLPVRIPEQLGEPVAGVHPVLAACLSPPGHSCHYRRFPVRVVGVMRVAARRIWSGCARLSYVVPQA